MVVYTKSKYSGIFLYGLNHHIKLIFQHYQIDFIYLVMIHEFLFLNFLYNHLKNRFYPFYYLHWFLSFKPKTCFWWLFAVWFVILSWLLSKFLNIFLPWKELSLLVLVGGAFKSFVGMTPTTCHVVQPPASSSKRESLAPSVWPCCGSGLEKVQLQVTHIELPSVFEPGGPLQLGGQWCSPLALRHPLWWQKILPGWWQ